MIGEKFFIEDDELAEKIDVLQSALKGISDQVLDLSVRRGLLQREVYELIRDAYPELNGVEFTTRYSMGLGTEIEIKSRAFD